MTADDKRASEARLVGGALCIDLINTVGWRMREQLGDWERLRGYDDLLEWSQHAGALGRADCRHLRRLAKQHPDQAEAALIRARRLREASYRILLRLAEEEAAAAEDLAVVNAELAEAP